MNYMKRDRTNVPTIRYTDIFISVHNNGIAIWLITYPTTNIIANAIRISIRIIYHFSVGLSSTFTINPNLGVSKKPSASSYD